MQTRHALTSHNSGIVSCGLQRGPRPAVRNWKKHTPAKGLNGHEPEQTPTSERIQGAGTDDFCLGPRGGPSHGNPSALPVRPVRPRMGVLGPRLENIGAELLDTSYHSVARL